MDWTGSKTKIYAIIAAAVVALIIIIQNTHSATLKILFWDFSPALILLLFAVYILGVITGIALIKFREKKETL